MSRSTRQALEGDGQVPAPAPRSVRADPSDGSALVVLLRVHRRLALRTMSVLFLGLFGLPLVLSFLPDLTHVTVFTVPLLWWLLGVGVYPLLWLLGYRHAVRAEQVEASMPRPGSEPR